MSRGTAQVILFSGLVLVSTSGPFFEMSHLPALSVVFYRLVGAAALFLLWALAKRQLHFTRPQIARIAFGAVFLAAHFMLWVKAFELTDFASNLLLLVMQPVTAAVVGHWLGERATRATWISVALALLGLAVVTGGDFARGSRALLGDAMCIVAGFAITAFFVLTRKVRHEVPLAPFMGVTLGVGAVCTLPIALAAGVPLSGFSVSAWGWLAALVVLTTVGGHGCFNIAARHTRLFTVNVVVVLEPAIAIAMGAMLFGASVTALQVGGGAILAVAVMVGLIPEMRAEHEPLVLPSE